MADMNRKAAFCGCGRFALLDQRRYRILLLLVSGVLTALTLVFPLLGVLEWVSLVLAGLVILRLGEENTARLRSLYGYGLLFFWGFYIVVFHWFVSMYPLDFVGLSPLSALFVVIAGVFGLSLLQALISGVAFVVYGRLSRSRTVCRYPFLRPFIFAACFTVFEWFQTVGWWGVPWGRLPLGQMDLSVTVQTSKWFGSYFVTFLLLCVNLCVAYAVLHTPFRKIAALTACGIFTLNALFGSLILLADRDDGETVTVAAIQGNIENKWAFGSLMNIKTVYREYTLLAAKDGAELVIWPETALPCELDSSLKTYLSELAKEANVTLIVGALRSETDADGEVRMYNSLYAVSPDGTFLETIYDKQKLVPFGEFVPMRAFVSAIFPPLAELGIFSTDYSRGEAGRNISTRCGDLGCMICFDSIYENVGLSAVRNDAELLCLSSNDAWFFDSAAIYMHHDQARLRAIETGRYLVRAGNSGITSVISPTGEVLTEIEPLTEGYVVSDVYLLNDRTLYSIIGNLFVYLLVAALAVPCFSEAYLSVRKRQKMREHQNRQDRSEKGETNAKETT